MEISVDNNRGVSLVELVVTLVILSILATLILPSAIMTSKRIKELELKRNLRTIRTALDDFKKSSDKEIEETKIIVQGKNGYPENLQELVDGHDFSGAVKVKKKFLRKIPDDPFHKVEQGADEKEKWGLRSYTDEPDKLDWGGEDVFDIYSKSEETAIDGTKYKDW